MNQMNQQQMFNKVVDYMRQSPKFNHSGSPTKGGRGWGYINPDNTCERCAKGVLMDADIFFTKKSLLHTRTFPEQTLKGYVNESIEAYIGRELTLSEVEMLNSLEVTFEGEDKPYWENNFQMIAVQHGLFVEEQQGLLVEEARKQSVDELEEEIEEVMEGL